MVIIDKTKNECKIIDFVCPFISRNEEREKDKMKGYNDLKRELKKIWDMPVKVTPVVVGALGTTPKKLKQRSIDNNNNNNNNNLMIIIIIIITTIIVIITQ